jgi:hypothetical protein
MAGLGKQTRGNGIARVIKDKRWLTWTGRKSMKSWNLTAEEAKVTMLRM